MLYTNSSVKPLGTSKGERWQQLKTDGYVNGDCVIWPMIHTSVRVTMDKCKESYDTGATSSYPCHRSKMVENSKDIINASVALGVPTRLRNAYLGSGSNFLLVGILELHT